MNRYISFYYIANTLLILTYPVFRYFIQSYRLAEQDSYGYSRENGVLCTALAFLWVQWKRSATIDHFLLRIFTVSKFCMTLLFGLIDIKYGLYFLFASLLLFLFAKQPKFTGPSKIIPITSEEQFQEFILKEQKGAKKSVKDAGGFANKNMWLVELFVDWAETCVYTKPIWSEFSMKYTTPNLKFAEVNLMTLPKMAEKYNINTSAISRQLPTLIMFEDGKEVIRFPPLDEDSKRYMKVIRYSKKDIAKYFDLEERYLATRFANGAQKPAPKDNKENKEIKENK